MKLHPWCNSYHVFGSPYIGKEEGSIILAKILEGING